MSEIVYNPLEKINLAKSIELELLSRPAIPLRDAGSIRGAGVYVIYYTGPHPAYADIAGTFPSGPMARPIYIGKAIPSGGRKGGITAEVSAEGRALANRLKKHITSITEGEGLELSDFHIRHLVVDDVWIPLGENMLIETFKPVWNVALDGFGNNDPGKRRKAQFKSPWDVLHPGRKAAINTTDSPELTVSLILDRVADHFAGRPLTPLPKAIVKQQDELEEEAADSADEA